jgi:hypothetical protein
MGKRKLFKSLPLPFVEGKYANKNGIFFSAEYFKSRSDQVEYIEWMCRVSNRINLLKPSGNFTYDQV